MHDDRINPNLLHQHHVAGEAFHCRVAAHGMAAKFDHHDRVIIALQIRQGFG